MCIRDRVSAAPLYAADVPANTPLAPQQVFRYNNHSDPGTLDPQKVEENTAAQIVLDLFEGLVLSLIHILSGRSE